LLQRRHSLINTVNFQGRASRGEFLSFIGLWFVWVFLLGTIVSAISALPFVSVFAPVLAFAPLILFIAFLSLLVRRYHDLDKRAWTLIFSLNPFGILSVVANVFREGDQRANQYGPMPD